MTVVINGTTGIDKVQDGSIVQADLATGVAGTAPAFSAYKPAGAAVSLTNGTFTKVAINTEEYDTANCYDTSTSRFTPNVAGYYSVTGNILVAVPAATTTALLSVFKNGARIKDLGYYAGTAIDGFMPSDSCQVYLNGTTDYIELYVLASSTGATSYSSDSGQFTYFQASMVRAA